MIFRADKMQTWQQWIHLNKNKMKHPVDFEERFVVEVLTQIKEIMPDDVIPQYHFIDFDGGNRYIDFCIKNEEKGYFLSIELDGRDKFLHQELPKTLERQNALVAKVGTLVRYANTTWLNNPSRVINEIQTILYSQHTKYMKEVDYKKRIENSLASYQKQLDEVLKQSQSHNQDQKIEQLNEVIRSLKQQLVEQKEKPQNDQTNEALKNINLMMLTLMQQVNELKERNQEIEIVEKTVSIVDKKEVPKSYIKRSNLTHTNMALICVIILLMVVGGTYLLKNEHQSELDHSEQLSTVDEKNSVEYSADFQPLLRTTTQEPKIELVQRVTQNNEDNYQLEESSIVAIPSGDISRIQASDAVRYVGQYKTVCGRVAQIKEFSKGTYLNIGQAYPSQDLTIVVWSSDQYQVGDIHQYANKNICISGKISTYKGIPQIKFNSADQVRM